jgi:dTDP-4-amino-4,6-dideoxygalactose transaminase
VTEPFIVFGRPDIRDAEINEVVEVLRSGWIGTGPRVAEFERRFAEFVSVPEALALNSCTAALHLALIGHEVGPGDEVITTPMTFASSANVIVHVGAKPVFVDVQPESGLLEEEAIEAAIGPRTRAILTVDYLGRPCDYGPIRELAERHGLPIIEDAAHAVEARWHGRRVGSYAHSTAFSFYATKNLTTAEGGMLVSLDPDVIGRARRLSLHGLSADAWARYTAKGKARYEVLEAGFKYNMTDIAAAIGLHQLGRLEENLAARERLWRTFDERLTGIEGLRLAPPIPAEDLSGRHLYTIKIEDPELRDPLIDHLKSRGVGTGIHFTALHLHPFYRERFGYEAGDFPEAEWIGARTVSLPFYPTLTEGEVDRITGAVREFVSGSR